VATRFAAARVSAPPRAIYRFFITTLLLSTRGDRMEEAGVCSNNTRLSLGAD
jgi:hypothetical protein